MPGGRSGDAGSPGPDQYRVYSHIEGDQGDAKPHVQALPVGRIDQSAEVVLGEGSLEAFLARQDAEPLLERSQRTCPSDQLDCDSVEEARQMHQSHAGPAENEQAAESDEEDERKVRKKHEVREASVNQEASPS